MKRNALLILLAASLVAVPAFAQDGNTSSSNRLTIEELYLSQDIELQLIRAQALSDDRSTKALALQAVEDMLDRGVVDNEGMLVILESLASEGTSRVVRQGGAVINDFPEIRRKSVELLGRVGGVQAQNTLNVVLRSDAEPTVLAEAMYALGNITEEDAGPLNDTLELMMYTIDVNNNKVTPDPNLAYAALISVEKLANRGIGLQNPELINAVIEMYGNGTYSPLVRYTALKTIYSLRGQELPEQHSERLDQLIEAANNTEVF